jgi:hypothetical protein
MASLFFPVEGQDLVRYEPFVFSGLLFSTGPMIAYA